ncbi:MAG TPA: ribosomal protein S18-alanine N-acetyltransferase [bacterium]|nr:ribosomal protein S18-alanine N-acetyltransferase [bacterium]
MTDDYLIQKMTESDLPEVLAIESASFPTPFTINLFRMELNLNVAHLFVIRKDGKVIGYIDFWRVGPEVHLITIGVQPDFRRRGVGTKLIEFMLGEARKNRVETVSLDVRPSNAAGLKLYQKFGFRQAGVRRRYYQDNDEDALVLSLHLKESEQPSAKPAE